MARNYYNRTDWRHRRDWRAHPTPRWWSKRAIGSRERETSLRPILSVCRLYGRVAPCAVALQVRDGPALLASVCLHWVHIYLYGYYIITPNVYLPKWKKRFQLIIIYNVAASALLLYTLMSVTNRYMLYSLDQNEKIIWRSWRGPYRRRWGAFVVWLVYNQCSSNDPSNGEWMALDVFLMTTSGCHGNELYSAGVYRFLFDIRFLRYIQVVEWYHAEYHSISSLADTPTKIYYKGLLSTATHCRLLYFFFTGSI
jgi:hypothetical protein